MLYGWRIAVEPVAEGELQRLQAQYYRPDTTGTLVNASLRHLAFADIASGRGFLLSLIGEAFRDYASDIHIEPL